MAVFVLLHGSYHGGWCWNKTTPYLRSDGHTVYTPTLTGLGERCHLVHPRAGLSLHIQDLVQVFEYEDLKDVVLVGHSYGGLVISGVAESCYERISHMVYLDGFLPDHGQSAFDINPGSEERWKEQADAAGTEWLVPPSDPADVYEINDADDSEWVRENLTATPVLTHSEPLNAPQERAKELPRSFIACTQYEIFDHMAEKAKEEGLNYYELDTGHDAMVTMPEGLSRILLEIEGQ